MSSVPSSRHRDQLTRWVAGASFYLMWFDTTDGNVYVRELGKNGQILRTRKWAPPISGGGAEIGSVNAAGVGYMLGASTTTYYYNNGASTGTSSTSLPRTLAMLRHKTGNVTIADMFPHWPDVTSTSQPLTITNQSSMSAPYIDADRVAWYVTQRADLGRHTASGEPGLTELYASLWSLQLDPPGGAGETHLTYPDTGTDIKAGGRALKIANGATLLLGDTDYVRQAPTPRIQTPDQFNYNAISASAERLYVLRQEPSTAQFRLDVFPTAATDFSTPAMTYLVPLGVDQPNYRYNILGFEVLRDRLLLLISREVNADPSNDYMIDWHLEIFGISQSEIGSRTLDNSPPDSAWFYARAELPAFFSGGGFFFGGVSFSTGPSGAIRAIGTMA